MFFVVVVVHTRLRRKIAQEGSGSREEQKRSGCPIAPRHRRARVQMGGWGGGGEGGLVGEETRARSLARTICRSVLSIIRVYSCNPRINLMRSSLPCGGTHPRPSPPPSRTRAYRRCIPLPWNRRPFCARVPCYLPRSNSAAAPAVVLN